MQVSKILNSTFGVPKTLGSMFGGQQGNTGMDLPILKVRECPPRWETDKSSSKSIVYFNFQIVFD